MLAARLGVVVGFRTAELILAGLQRVFQLADTILELVDAVLAEFVFAFPSSAAWPNRCGTRRWPTERRPRRRVATFSWYRFLALRRTELSLRHDHPWPSCRQPFSSRLSRVFDHVVDQTVFQGLLGRHETVAVGVLLDFFQAGGRCA